MGKKVKLIPSTINPLTQTPLDSITKRKTAAYARVSTDSDEQYTSYEAQVTYYSKFIQDNPKWEYVKVYADEGITGTNTKNRQSFKEMINDALEGKIDLIITKSISRFARNTLDTISYVRKLKAKGIEVYFEKENLWSLDDKTEFLLTIMASMAQEESRSISQNVTLGKRWGMQEGKVSFAYKNFLGYKKVDGKIVIDEDQAVIVRLIYRQFLIDGKTCSGIASFLKEHNIKTPSGKNCNWTKNTVDSILTNEKYKGDALLQKKYTADYLEHRVVKNEGQLPQYYVENNHPAIIDREDWEQVQTEMKRRAILGASYSSANVFASKIKCEDCGGFYGRKLWHSNEPYAKYVFQCNKKYRNKEDKCKTPTMSEDDIKRMFIKTYNEIMKNRSNLITDTKEVIALLRNTTEIDDSITSYRNEIEVVSNMITKMVNENAVLLQDQNEYLKRYGELERRYEKTKSLLDKFLEERKYKEGQAIRLESFLKNLENHEAIITAWSDEIWMFMIEEAVVHRDKSITFKFYNGIEKKMSHQS
ncbi:recombinase family protein [Acholeplasma sp. OttesenSCG-928-E16]|nr:recombinase family protein [Acholeplasma sp. OttesenSCG-928-E16]